MCRPRRGGPGSAAAASAWSPGLTGPIAACTRLPVAGAEPGLDRSIAALAAVSVGFALPLLALAGIRTAPAA